MLTTFAQGLKVYIMSENEFNLPLWNERFDNIRNDVEEIKKNLAELGKLMILTIVGITGWALVNLYTQIMSHPAHAEVPVATSTLPK